MIRKPPNFTRALAKWAGCWRTPELAARLSISFSNRLRKSAERIHRWYRGYTRERAQSFLTDDHIERIIQAYEQFKDEPGLARVATLEEIRAKDGNLSIPLYVESDSSGEPRLRHQVGLQLPVIQAAWLKSSTTVRSAIAALLEPANRPEGATK